MSSEIEVVKPVVKSSEKLLIFKSRETSCWEFLTRETEKNELEVEALHFLKENTGIESGQIEDFRPGDSYGTNERRVTPVYIELVEENKDLIDEESLPEKYTDFNWIEITRFDGFETHREYRALEHLDVVNGRVALAFVERDGKFLAVKRSKENSTPGKWSTVSGSIEHGETTEEAAVRELSEETGLEAEIERTGEYYIGRGENGVWRLEPVLMRYTSGEVDLNWELSEHRWVKPEEVENLDTIGKMKGFDKLGLKND